MPESSKCIPRDEWDQAVQVEPNIYKRIRGIVASLDKSTKFLSDNSMIHGDAFPLVIRCADLRRFLNNRWLSTHCVEFCMVNICNIASGGKVRVHGSEVYEVHPNGRGTILIFNFTWFARFGLKKSNIPRLNRSIKALNLSWAEFKTWIFGCCTGSHYLLAEVSIEKM